MESRKNDLSALQSYIGKIDSDLTLILQELHWDQDNLSKSTPMVQCQYNGNHRIPTRNREAHTKQCFLAYNDYSKDEMLLPDPGTANSGTLVKFANSEINEIITNAANADPSFTSLARGSGPDLVQPLSLDRLQSTYSQDERRALYDAVVRAAPACHDLSDLILSSENDDGKKDQQCKSRTEILAELRNMRRRRTKYRVSAKTTNYSHVLRDLIKTQMELYTEGKQETNVGTQQEKDHHRSDRREHDKEARDNKEPRALEGGDKRRPTRRSRERYIDDISTKSYQKRNEKRRDRSVSPHAPWKIDRHERSRNYEDRQAQSIDSGYKREKYRRDENERRPRDVNRYDNHKKDRHRDSSRDKSTENAQVHIKEERYSDDEANVCTYKKRRISESEDSRGHSNRQSSRRKQDQRHRDVNSRTYHQARVKEGLADFDDDNRSDQDRLDKHGSKKINYDQRYRDVNSHLHRQKRVREEPQGYKDHSRVERRQLDKYGSHRGDYDERHRDIYSTSRSDKGHSNRYGGKGEVYEYKDRDLKSYTNNPIKVKDKSRVGSNHSINQDRVKEEPKDYEDIRRTYYGGHVRD